MSQTVYLKTSRNSEMFKDAKIFFDVPRKSLSTVYFKISFFKKHCFKKSTLPSSYFRINLKTIKSVYKKYSSLFSR